MVPYDLKYALRLATEKGLSRAAVHLYTTLGLHEEAVELALDVDLELAKQCAKKPKQSEPDNQELTKKLWLRIGNDK